jgi:hypothetical protein
MKTLTHALLLAAALAAPAAAGDLTPADRAALNVPAPTALCELRAAGLNDPACSDLDRSELASAQQQAPDLADLRAGELNDHDLTIIGVTLLIVIAIAIIA